MCLTTSSFSFPTFLHSSATLNKNCKVTIVRLPPYVYYHTVNTNGILLPKFIPAFLLVRLVSSILPCLFLPSYWLGSCPQVYHFHPCLLIGLSLLLKSPIFISAFLSVRLLSTSLPCSSLPSYWSGSCPQVSHVHPCLLIGRALVLKSPIFSSCPQVSHVHPNLVSSFT